MSTAAVREIIDSAPVFEPEQPPALPAIPDYPVGCLPSSLRELVTVHVVIVCADHDARGVQAAHVAAERWTAEGRTVRLAVPPEGCDFNDLARQAA